ncbi:hypothetical protein NVP1187O_206 [Vibrio phage 1.187.O._10N.286.49.F1]|nr:hypothetical protein NVP1187O_206 [Vibrio phage 1.187.O._10N.286.49.F1]
MYDEFFQDNEVQETLISRAKTKHNSVCISGEDVGGVYCRYSSEYLGWNLLRKWSEVAVCLSDDERKQWVIDNPEPVNKFKERV